MRFRGVRGRHRRTLRGQSLLFVMFEKEVLPPFGTRFGRLPQRRALIGIQPRDIDWSDHPSAPVAAAIPEVCDLARDLIRSWQ